MQVTANPHHYKSQNNNKDNIACIDVDKRIDYALRFSDQAVLVVDENRQELENVSKRFLTTIPEEHNVALVAISPKFNDIQVRCRIIEQLDRSALFDPEQSLAISLINMAKKSKQLLTIVITQSQHLSLQLIYELSQLAHLASKSKLTISVVMYGLPEAAIAVFDSRKLFKSKVAIFSASTGQLISKSNAILQKKSNPFTFLKNKGFIALISFILSVSIGVLWLSQHPNFIFTNEIATAQTSKHFDVINERQDTVLKKIKKNTPQFNPFQHRFFQQEDDRATDYVTWQQEYIDNRNHLQTLPKREQVLLASKKTMETSGKNEVLASERSKTSQENKDVLSDVNQTEAIDFANVTLEEIAAVINQDKLYFEEHKLGYVLQFAAVSSKLAVKQYLSLMPNHEVHFYQRAKNKTNIVITSGVYKSKANARQALASLPDGMKSLHPWIKSIKKIKTEINL